MAWSLGVMVTLTCLIFGGTVAEFFLVPRTRYLWVSGLGLVLFALANVLRIRATQALGRFWSLQVEIREQHQFVREGPYRWVRHPAYASFVIEHIAVPLVGNAWWSLTAAVVLYVPMVLLRLNTEEGALVGKFGDVYRRYQAEVRALVPRVFRRSGS